MKKLLYLITLPFAMLFLSGQLTAQNTPQQYASAIDSCNRYAEMIKNKFTIPGMQITVMKDNAVIWSKSFGYRNLKKSLSLQNYNKMRIASISKMFTSVGIMKLVEMNRLNLDTAIQAYVPDFPHKSHPITVRQLLNHTSGIRHYNNNEYDNPLKAKTIEQSLAYIRNDSLLFEPGTKVLYSSYAYNLLGVIIQRISGTPYQEFINKYLIYPATLKYTMPDRVGTFIKNKSEYYYLDDKKIIRSTNDFDLTFKLPTGGYLSTSYEIAKFASELMNGKILNEAALQQYLSPTFLKDKSNTYWNLGLKNTQMDSKTNVFWQMGSTYGGCSAVMFEPKSKTAICWLSNMSVKWTEEEVLQLMKYMLNAEISQPKKAENKK